MLIDSHCHIDFDDFAPDRALVIRNAQQLGVQKIVVPAVAQATWQRAINICNEFTALELALGLHPIFIQQHQPHHLAELDALITALRPLAVGEIGLDYYLPELDREKQRAYLSKQLIIANRHRLPVIIHCRKAHDDCLKLLTETPVPGGIIHAFNGSMQQAEKYLEKGFLLGFGGMLTYARSRKLRRLAQSLPLASMVLETDAPDMTVAAHQGQRNSPEYLPDIAAELASIKGISVAEVATTTSNNFAQLFSVASLE